MAVAQVYDSQWLHVVAVTHGKSILIAEEGITGVAQSQYESSLSYFASIVRMKEILTFLSCGVSRSHFSTFILVFYADFLL